MRSSSVRTHQVEGLRTHPNDEAGLIGTLSTKAAQACGTGEVAVADADFSRNGRATLDRLRAMLVGQLKVRETAASEVVDRMQPPIGGLAAVLAKATAIGVAQDPISPSYHCAGSLVRQLAAQHGVEKPTARSSRFLTAGSLILAMPSIVAQAAVWLSDNPPGPRANETRSKSRPLVNVRLRAIRLQQGPSA